MFLEFLFAANPEMSIAEKFKAIRDAKGLSGLPTPSNAGGLQKHMMERLSESEEKQRMLQGKFESLTAQVADLEQNMGQKLSLVLSPFGRTTEQDSVLLTPCDPRNITAEELLPSSMPNENKLEELYREQQNCRLQIEDLAVQIQQIRHERPVFISISTSPIAIQSPRSGRGCFTSETLTHQDSAVESRLACLEQILQSLTKKKELTDSQTSPFSAPCSPIPKNLSLSPQSVRKGADSPCFLISPNGGKTKVGVGSPGTLSTQKKWSNTMVQTPPSGNGGSIADTPKCVTAPYFLQANLQDVQPTQYSQPKSSSTYSPEGVSAYLIPKSPAFSEAIEFTTVYSTSFAPLSSRFIPTPPSFSPNVSPLVLCRSSTRTQQKTSPKPKNISGSGIGEKKDRLNNCLTQYTDKANNFRQDIDHYFLQDQPKKITTKLQLLRQSNAEKLGIVTGLCQFYLERFSPKERQPGTLFLKNQEGKIVGSYVQQTESTKKIIHEIADKNMRDSFKSKTKALNLIVEHIKEIGGYNIQAYNATNRGALGHYTELQRCDIALRSR